jgi:hypothetical protein
MGLRLISHLSIAWGVEDRNGDGKCVWFDVELPGSG